MLQFKMEDYPLSAKSSKKLQGSTSQFKNSLLDKSACQQFDTRQLNKQDYQHILVGERIFIQLYYRGSITQTAYDQYIPFMGGTLYKRLNPKVNIFLTNPDEKQIALILERVKKICSTCKVVSILWLQQCFRQKKKVSFDEFVIEAKPQKIQQQEGSKTKKIENQLQQFLKNIGEDVHTDFKEYLKSNTTSYFQILNKNHNLKPHKFFPSTVFELPPNKRQRQKQQNPKKKRKGSIKIDKVNQQTNQGRGSKSMGEQALKKVLQKQQKQDQDEYNKQIMAEKQHANNNKNERNTKIINNLMEKYLTKAEELREDDDDLTITAQNMDNVQKKQILQITNTQSKGEPKKSLKRIFYSEVYNKSKVIQPKKNKISSQCDNRMTFGIRGSFYKNIPIKMPAQLQELALSNRKPQAHLLHQLLGKKSDNKLNVISQSGPLAKRIGQINRNANQDRSIVFQLITIQAYLSYISAYNQSQHAIYYLLNIKKLEDKVIYFYLTINNPNPPILVNERLIEEIQSYNKKVKDPQFKSPLKMQKIRFKFMNKIKFYVDKKQIVNKKIVFLQSSFEKEVIKKIIHQMGAILITPDEYLFGKKPDLVVTNKSGLPQKGVKTIKQDQLWQKLLKFQAEELPA